MDERKLCYVITHMRMGGRLDTCLAISEVLLLAAMPNDYDNCDSDSDIDGDVDVDGDGMPSRY
jgi:hypothetical protein